MNLHKYRKGAKSLYGVEKVEKLNEVLALCIASYKENSINSTRDAMAWTLIDLANYYISISYLNEASYFYMLLDAIDFDVPDQWIEDKKGKLRRRIDRKHKTIDKWKGLIRKGDLSLSFSLKHLRDLHNSGELSVINHELYGWTLYKCIIAFEEKLTVDEVKKYLRTYLGLSNLKPSRLHQTIMDFSGNYSKGHSDFNLTNFNILCKVDTSKNSMINYHNIIEIGTKEFYRLKSLKYD